MKIIKIIVIYQVHANYKFTVNTYAQGYIS
jgi:hypothetical protein